jgi:hypothetical protein
MNHDAEIVDPGTLWKVIAIIGIAITTIAFASSVNNVFTEWHGDHFERVGGTIALLTAAVIVTVVLSVTSLIAGWRSRARRWAFVG